MIVPVFSYSFFHSFIKYLEKICLHTSHYFLRRVQSNLRIEFPYPLTLLLNMEHRLRQQEHQSGKAHVASSFTNSQKSLWAIEIGQFLEPSVQTPGTFPSLFNVDTLWPHHHVQSLTCRWGLCDFCRQLPQACFFHSIHKSHLAYVPCSRKQVLISGNPWFAYYKQSSTGSA